jgi:lysophospholipid acyltransferase
MALTNGTLFEKAKGEDAKRHVPKGRKRVAYMRGALGLAFLITYSLLSPSFTYSRVLKKEWLTHSLFVRLVLIQFIGFIERTKYFGVWKLSEVSHVWTNATLLMVIRQGACIVTGLGFSGYDAEGRSTWDDIANINIPWVEMAPNFKILLDSWNIRTNIWLRECVYKRITPQGRKPGFKSTILTFLTSAVWHGTYTGYYLTFALGGFVQTAARLARTNLRPLFLSPLEILPPKLPDALAKQGFKIPPPPITLLKQIYDVLGTITTTMILNFIPAPFILWYWSTSLEAWKRMDYYGLWIIGLAFAFFYGGGGAACRKWNEQRLKRATKSVAKDIVGENYHHPTLRTNEMKGTGLQNMPPVDQAVLEVEELVEKLVERLKAEAKNRKTK